MTFDTISTELNTLTSNHKSYPVLHYFYSSSRAQAPAAQLPVPDEALVLLRFGVAKRSRPPELILQATSASIENYVETLDSSFITPAARTPPLPDFDRLADADIPTVSAEEFHESVAARETHRRTLLGLVESDVREWPSSER